MKKRIKVTLIHHPTVALRISGFTDPAFEAYADSGIYLGNVYRRIIPQSLTGVAAVMERELPVDVEILDLRIVDPDREETYKVLDWEGYELETRRVGAAFSYADEAIAASDWIGLSSHFTFESAVVRDLIAHARGVNPAVKVLVGGADVKARPAFYVEAGADMVFRGDFSPQAVAEDDWTQPVVGDYRHPFAELTAPAFDKLPHLMEYQDSHDGTVPDGVSYPIGFAYFTRGCPRECDFCESRLTKFEALELDACFELLENYQKAGIRALNFADDNLLLRAAKKAWRDQFLELLRTMRRMGFAWEFPNGLELGRLIKNGQLDEELMEALFTHEVDPETGRIVGAYRVYAPVETFSRRDHYRKLKPVEEQNRIIDWIAGCGLPEMNFGVVLPVDADEATFESIREGYLAIKDIVTRRGKMRARYAIFHLIPIALYRDMPTKYSVEALPEGWNFYFPVYDGSRFTARELFERRLALIKEIDPVNYESMRAGQYAYA